MKDKTKKKLKCRECGENEAEVGVDIVSRLCASCVQKGLSLLSPNCTSDGASEEEPED